MIESSNQRVPVPVFGGVCCSSVGYNRVTRVRVIANVSDTSKSSE